VEKHRIADGLARIIELGEEMLGTFDIEELLIKVVRHAQDLLSAEGATLFLIVPGERLLVSHVIVSDNIKEIILRIDETSVAGFTAIHQRPVNIPDAYADLTHIHPELRFNQSIDEAYGKRTRNILSMPVGYRGESIGVFQVVNRKDGAFGEEDEFLMKSFAVLVGIAIRNARQLEMICDERQKNRDLIEHTSDVVVVLDRKARIVDFNLKAAEVVKAATEAPPVKGMPFAQAFPGFGNLGPEIAKMVDQSLDKVVSRGKVPFLMLSTKNSRDEVEKIYLILHRADPTPGPMASD